MVFITSLHKLLRAIYSNYYIFLLSRSMQFISIALISRYTANFKHVLYSFSSITELYFSF